jgi:hypothetical protein
MLRRDPVEAGAPWVVSSISKLARTFSIVVRTKEEHQIRVMVEFEVER